MSTRISCRSSWRRGRHRDGRGNYVASQPAGRRRWSAVGLLLGARAVCTDQLLVPLSRASQAAALSGPQWHSGKRVDQLAVGSRSLGARRDRFLRRRRQHHVARPQPEPGQRRRGPGGRARGRTPARPRRPDDPTEDRRRGRAGCGGAPRARVQGGSEGRRVSQASGRACEASWRLRRRAVSPQIRLSTRHAGSLRPASGSRHRSSVSCSSRPAGGLHGTREPSSVCAWSTSTRRRTRGVRLCRRDWAFFAPCAFSLFPAYISYYLTAAGTGPERPRRSLALGLTCAAGSATFFALAAVAITMLGGVVSHYLVAMKPVIAVAVVLFGVGLVADVRLPSFSLPSEAAGKLAVDGWTVCLRVRGCACDHGLYVAHLRLDHRPAADKRIERGSADHVRQLCRRDGVHDGSHEPAGRIRQGQRGSLAPSLDRLDQNGQAAWC